MKYKSNFCEGKRKHESKGKAEAHLRSLNEKEPHYARRGRVYICGRCRAYHVGRKPLTKWERKVDSIF